MSGRTTILGVVLLIGSAAGCDDSASQSASGTGSGGTSSAAAASPAKAAAIQWARAVASGDVEAAKALSAGNEEELKGFESYVAIGESETKLNAAVKEKLGGEPQGGMLQHLPATMEAADERIEGNTATLTHDRLNEPLTLVKAPDGKWKVEVAGLAVGATIFDKSALSNREAEEDVRAGHLKTPEAAWKQAGDAAAFRFGASGAKMPRRGGDPEPAPAAKGGPPGGRRGGGGPGKGGTPGGQGEGSPPPAPAGDDATSK